MPQWVSTAVVVLSRAARASGLTQRLMLAESEQRRGEGIALLAAFALRHGPARPHSVPPAVAGGLAVKEPDEGEKLWRNLAKLAEEGYAGHGVVCAQAIQ